MANYKIVDADKLDSDLSTLADSIRAKSGTGETLAFPDGMKEAVDGIQAADTTQEDGLVTGTLTEYTNNRVTRVRDRLFYNVKSLQSVNFPNVTSVGGQVFYQCSIKYANFPSCASFGNAVFNYCYSLETVNAPLLKTISGATFSNCSALTEVSFPVLETVDGSEFRSCSKLKKADLGFASNFGSGFFYSTKLKYLVLRKSTTATLQDIGAFSSTPFAANGTGGWAIVPRAWIESYQTATNWSTLYAAGTCTFLPLEDYTVDGTTTGEIDWSKIEEVTE